MRAFYALPIPQEARELLWRGLEPMRRAMPGIAWVEEAQLHITLYFLGEIDEAQARRARDLLEDPALARPPFAVELGGLDSFPPRGRPRVLYARLTAGREECLSCYGRLAPGARQIAAEDGRAYTPHVTVGRIRRPGEGGSLAAGRFPAELGAGARARFTVERCSLFESVLRRDGPRYREIASVQLR